MLSRQVTPSQPIGHKAIHLNDDSRAAIPALVTQ